MFNFIVLGSIIVARGLKSEDVQQQHKCLLQVHKHSRAMPSHRVLSHSKWWGVQGSGGKLNASLDGVCDEDIYYPSELEQGFSSNVMKWTETDKSLCEHLDSRYTWLEENVKGEINSGGEIFSRMCKKGEAPQRLEPLAGVLRNPKMFCDSTDLGTEFNIDYLVLADGRNLSSSSKKILFDAGGSNFMESMSYFTGQYGLRGIELDQIYVWEATPRGDEAYWHGTPDAAREKWQPRLTFYDGVPITADPDAEHNPVRRIISECKAEDFCAFKLDIDAPDIELPIVEQILASTEAASVLDEFFFEHHVSGIMELGWGHDVNGTFADSYDMFTKLRKMGVRAHSWI